jgi:DNA-directed RNA polymerase sigma subunit (sigma70/sigma32)
LDDAEETDLQDEQGVVAGDDEDLSHALMEEEENASGFSEEEDGSDFEDADVPRSTPKTEASEGEPTRERYDGDTAFKLYLREIGQVALLTPDEEIALAVRIQKGDGEARDQMIKANLRLVVKIAHDYEGLGLPLLDLINEGNIGLMKAVERFDPTKGSKLSTYSAWWIKQAIKRSLPINPKRSDFLCIWWIKFPSSSVPP